VGSQWNRPPAYVIAEVEKDPAKTEDPTAAQRYLIVSDKVQTVEGEAPKGYIVVIAFDSLEKARGWYYSPAYEAIKPLRQNSKKSRILIIEGVTAQWRCTATLNRGAAVREHERRQGAGVLLGRANGRLLNSLSRVNELQVAGRTASFYFKGKDVG
jgi:uncharacterized protein (DUF1330 family)